MTVSAPGQARATSTGTGAGADRVSLICPRCDTPSAFAPVPGRSILRCPACRGRFGALIAVVRTKNSQADKRLGTRNHRVRVRYGGIEELVRFPGRYDDIEMKGGDGVAFLWRGRHLCRVQNLTLGSSTRLRTTQPVLPMAAVLAAIGVAVAAARHFGAW